MNHHALLERFRLILQKKKLYKRLLQCEATDAQKLLDTLQHLLDVPELDSRLRMDLIVALQRISTKTGLYPACYQLENVDLIDRNPVRGGGFADIHKAQFRGQVVCLKTMRLYQGDRVEHVLKILSKEVVLWSQLSHPNVLEIYGLFRFQGRPSLVSAWIENGDITTYLRRNSSASRPRLVLDVGKGLVYLHGLGMVHGDLKGSNVLVDDTGRALLADFGISSVSDTNIVAWTSQTKGVSRGGSVRWQAPELFAIRVNGKEELEAPKNTMASDVYAWGCVALEIFTGLVPFASLPNEAQVIYQLQSGVRPLRPPTSDPSWTRYGMTEEIWRVMEDCWNKDPSHRPSATAVVQLLKALPGVEDIQPSFTTHRLSAVDFRRQMGISLDITITDVLDSVLQNTGGDPDTDDAEEEDAGDLQITLPGRPNDRASSDTGTGGNIPPIVSSQASPRTQQATELSTWSTLSHSMQWGMENVQNGLSILGNDTIYLVIGGIGVGKDTFINCALGRDVVTATQTDTVCPFAMTDTGALSSGRTFLVDTPDLNDTQWHNRVKKLRLILDWLETSCQPDTKLGGIILLARDELRTGLPEFFVNFVRPWGAKLFNYMVLAILNPTDGPDVTFPEMLNRLFFSLTKFQDRFKDGCRLASFDNTTESARQILDMFPETPITVEVLRKEIGTVLGRQNNDPSSELKKMVFSFLSQQNMFNY